jgi:hypothetical protein
VSFHFCSLLVKLLLDGQFIMLLITQGTFHFLFALPFIHYTVFRIRTLLPSELEDVSTFFLLQPLSLIAQAATRPNGPPFMIFGDSAILI